MVEEEPAHISIALLQLRRDHDVKSRVAAALRACSEAADQGAPVQGSAHRVACVFFILQSGTGPGDGTVPAESGRSPQPYVVQLFKHEGKLKSHESYDHQFSFNAKVAQATTFYSIIRIVNTSEILKTLS